MNALVRGCEMEDLSFFVGFRLGWSCLLASIRVEQISSDLTGVRGLYQVLIHSAHFLSYYRSSETMQINGFNCSNFHFRSSSVFHHVRAIVEIQHTLSKYVLVEGIFLPFGW
uniref:(northern house mosquito) hypothetical protein n=1 Tax=Culex pipiens TaxID=7175 RepID=A0A8D8BJQ5_CULPI